MDILLVDFRGTQWEDWWPLLSCDMEFVADCVADCGSMWEELLIPGHPAQACQLSVYGACFLLAMAGF